MGVTHRSEGTLSNKTAEVVLLFRKIENVSYINSYLFYPETPQVVGSVQLKIWKGEKKRVLGKVKILSLFLPLQVSEL